MGKSRISTVKARYLGENQSGLVHFHIYELQTWIDADLICLSIMGYGRLGYSTLADLAKDWQLINGHDTFKSEPAK